MKTKEELKRDIERMINGILSNIELQADVDATLDALGYTDEEKQQFEEMFNDDYELTFKYWGDDSDEQEV